MMEPDKYESLLFKQIKSVQETFMQENKENISNIIYKSLLYQENITHVVSLDLSFPNGKTIYFYLNGYIDEPVYITNIFLCNGESLLNKIDKTGQSELKRVAVINDKDGYTNVREEPYGEAKILWVVSEGEKFYFTPNSDKNWWKVESYDGQKKGYMYQNRISPIGKQPVDLYRPQRVFFP
ncbi:MAG: SH3 domain-containing protein, partial [Bacteroidales bacterium]|nr:SH3 domain-containing protein [Bacteroidales bacterium]